MNQTPQTSAIDLHAADTLAQCFAEQPVLTQQSAALSLQLSAAAYQMRTAPWQEQGWTDFSYQVDRTLMTGSKVNASHGVHGKISRLFTHLARRRVLRSDPISQLYGTLRQREKSDTCKSLVMAHPLSDGRYLIAIGFMGTGKRLFDWISNFRLSSEENMHRGFLQLAEEFESRSDDIRFPRIARELGLEKLTLDMILEECTREDSRFLIWMSGHSQGGAVMQVFTHHLLKAGVLTKNLYGVGFASPTVIHDGHAEMFSHYPLHHLICSDDLTPRIGAKRHLGTCHVLVMTNAMRASFYGNAQEQPGFMPLLYQINRLADTRSTLLFALGFLRALSHVSDRDASAVISSLSSMNMPDLLTDWLGDSVSRIMTRVINYLTRSYRQFTGESNPPKGELRRYERMVLHLMHTYTPRGFASLLASVLSAPHHLQGKGNCITAYEAMTQNAFSVIRPMDFIPGAWPVRCQPVHAKRKQRSRPRSGLLSLMRVNRR